MKLSTPIIVLFGSSVVGASIASHAQAILHAIPSQATLGSTPKVPGDSPLYYCVDDHAADILQIEYIDIDPNPPAVGANATVTAAGALSETIEEGAYARIQVKYGYVKIFTKTLDVCEQVVNVDEECPVEKGKKKVVKTVELPNDIPPGKYTVFIDIYTKDDKRITCLTAEVTF